MYQPTESAKRIQAIVATLEEKRMEVEKCRSDANRAKIAFETSEKAVNQIRRQLSVELGKFDPSGFGAVTLDAVADALAGKAQ